MTVLLPTEPSRSLGNGDPVLVVAELSGNHNGRLETALELIRAARAAGADAVKLQTYTADTITMDAPGEWFEVKGGPWDGRRLYELYREASTPWEWHRQLFAAARAENLICFSTAFDPTSVDFLEELGNPIYKVASFEVVDLPLLTRIAATRKPVILSTGMATMGEIDAAVRTLRTGGTPGLVLLNCASAYPARPEDMHLRNLSVLKAAFDCPVGLSDHTTSSTCAVAAVALGACMIEKHLCWRRADGGPDAGFSLEPPELTELVRSVREAEQALASPPRFGPGGAEAGNVIFRKSLFAARDLPAGRVLGPEDVRVIRPGHGLPVAMLPVVLGRVARTPIARGTPLSWELLS